MNKKAIKRTAVRRRGTTIAAAALSVALVAPFVHPVVAPQTAAVASAAEITDADGNYIPADTGRIYDNGEDDACDMSAFCRSSWMHSKTTRSTCSRFRI